MPFIAIIIAYVTRRFRRISVRIQDSVTNVTEAVDEAVLGHRIVKIYNGQAFEREYFSRVNEDNRWLSMKVVATRAGSSALIRFIAAWAVRSEEHTSELQSLMRLSYAVFRLQKTHDKIRD